MELEKLFTLIRTYHEKLGYPKRTNKVIDSVQEANRIILALHHEISELGNSYPWKPWRPIQYKDIEFDNMVFEITDILFFLGSFMEIFNITPNELEKAFEIKLRENYKRIERGYNETSKS